MAAERAAENMKNENFLVGRGKIAILMSFRFKYGFYVHFKKISCVNINRLPKVGFF